MAVAQAAAGENLTLDQADTAAVDAPRRERAERGERGDGARRERGGRRNERRPTADEAAQAGSDEAVAAVTSTDADAAPADGAQDAPDGNGAGQRRSRDRYGRERRGRGRGENGDAPQGADAPGAATVETGAEEAVAAAGDEAPVRSYFTRQPEAVAPVTPAAPAEATVAPAVTAAPVVDAPAPQPAAVAVAAGLPKVTSFTLEVDALAHIAQASGLEWVHSDSDKVQQALAAIAAEPKPIHVPREPKPVAAVDDGPLVLVETRKDLRNMVLPFEQATSPAAH